MDRQPFEQTIIQKPKTCKCGLNCDFVFLSVYTFSTSLSILHIALLAFTNINYCLTFYLSLNICHLYFDVFHLPITTNVY